MYVCKLLCKRCLLAPIYVCMLILFLYTYTSMYVFMLCIYVMHCIYVMYVPYVHIFHNEKNMRRK